MSKTNRGARRGLSNARQETRSPYEYLDYSNVTGSNNGTLGVEMDLARGSFYKRGVLHNVQTEPLNPSKFCRSSNLILREYLQVHELLQVEMEQPPGELNEMETPADAFLLSLLQGENTRPMANNSGETSHTRGENNSFLLLEPEKSTNDFEKEDVEREGQEVDGLLTDCPFQQFGCDAYGIANSENFWKHTQLFCPFRSIVCSFIPECHNETRLAYGGYIKGHLVDLQQTPVAYFTFNEHQDFPVYLDLNLNILGKTSGQLLFVDPAIPRLMFPLIMSITGDYVYIWIYKITNEDLRQGTFFGELTIFPRANDCHPRKNNESLVGKDIIHDVSVPMEEIIESGRLIKTTFFKFADNYISKLTEVEADGKGVERYFYNFDLVIEPTATKWNKTLKQQDEKSQLGKAEEDRRLSKKYAASLQSLPYSIENVALQRKRLQDQVKKP